MTEKELFSFRDYKGQIQIPLYKYYGNVEYAIDAIKNKRIHLEAPCEYNDLYDSAFFISKNTLKNLYNTSDAICNLLKNWVSPQYHAALCSCQENVSSSKYSVYEAIEYICNLDSSFSRLELVEECIQGCSNGGPVQPINNKISCFSEKNDSILMWAYYANNAKGVCLGFNIQFDSLLRDHCHKVQYSDKFLLDPKGFDMYFRKSEEWAHEQEWRIVCDTPAVYVPTDSLFSVILGYRLPPNQYHELVELGIKHGLQVYRMRPSTEKYEIIIEPLKTNCTHAGENNEV